MADTKEVFEMITRTRPDDGALARQHLRQQRRRRNERVLVFALAAAIVSGVVIGVVATRPTAHQPASSPSAAPVGTDGPLLVAIDASTGKVLRTIATGVAPFQPDVSPDGSSIAYVKDADGGHPQIFVSDVDGSHVRQVTGLPGQPGCGCGAIDPDWSPDGTKIAYSAMNLRGGRDIYLLDLGSGAIKQLTNSPLAGEAKPTWSPDGRSIAFEKGTPTEGCCGSDTTGSIVVMELRGGGASVVAKMREAAAPAWTPNGSWIAFSGIGPGGTEDLWLVRPGRANIYRLLTGPNEDTTPAWSPDGASIAFDRGQVVAILDEASGGVRSLGQLADPAWSSDGRILYGWRP